MTKKNIQYCSLASLGRTTALCYRPGDGAGLTASRALQHHRLEEDDCVIGPGTAQVNNVVGLGTAPGALRGGLWEGNVVAGSGIALRAWGQHLCGRWHHRLGSGKMVNDVTVVGNDGMEAPERTRQCRV
jgi:hypothetical protein